MRILYLGNNWVGWKVVDWLTGRGEDIAGLVMHPPAKREYGEEIITASGLDPSKIIDGSRLHLPEVVESVSNLGADMAVSVLFDYILRPEFIELFPQGIINLHPSYLPYNRGAYPNVWSIVEQTPAGVTLHYIDSGVDTGDIISQRKVEVEPVDTGLSLYRRLEKACVELFIEAWPGISKGNAPRIPQVGSEGTYHRANDAARIDEIDLDRSYTARELIDVMRARTFPPHTGAYFLANGRKVYIRTELLYEEDPEVVLEEPALEKETHADNN